MDLPPAVLVHTGQHYDAGLKEQVFEDLGLQQPDIDLRVGSGSHAFQTAEIMKAFEPVLERLAPSCVIVVGDVNSTLACSLVAAKRSTPVAHVEAGLRSFDRTMPEEINRLLTDQIAELLYTTEAGARSNLLREGVAEEKIHFVGNLMIDSLRAAIPRSKLPDGVELKQFALVTLHRPSNVDSSGALDPVLKMIGEVANRLPVVWPMHPRTDANIERFGLKVPGDSRHPILLLPPQGYLSMVALMRVATAVLTDSGGVQEETTALGVPCLTLRTNTERPITIEQGTNTLVGTDGGKLLSEISKILRTGGKRGRVPEYWDGHSAERIADHLAAWLRARHPDRQSRDTRTHVDFAP
jgi:UDP-N-acetylglucosamine 2-epimerase (non-hydrolysing)